MARQHSEEAKLLSEFTPKWCSIMLGAFPLAPGEPASFRTPIELKVFQTISIYAWNYSTHSWVPVAWWMWMETIRGLVGIVFEGSNWKSDIISTGFTSLSSDRLSDANCSESKVLVFLPRTRDDITTIDEDSRGSLLYGNMTSQRAAGGGIWFWLWLLQVEYCSNTFLSW